MQDGMNYITFCKKTVDKKCQDELIDDEVVPIVRGYLAINT